MRSTIEYFDFLTSNNLRVIPLKANSKSPMCKGWTIWDKTSCRNAFLTYPDANMGLLLGNVIDVEGDTPEANEILLNLINDYPHPCYQSTKSIHHLFISPDPKLRIFCHNGMEFRGTGHQSVIPPSRHEDTVYQWISMEPFPVPPMPKNLLKFLSEKIGKSQKGPFRAICANCRQKVTIHKKRFDLESRAFKLMGQTWQCHECRAIDIRPVCRSIR